MLKPLTVTFTKLRWAHQARPAAANPAPNAHTAFRRALRPTRLPKLLTSGTLRARPDAALAFR